MIFLASKTGTGCSLAASPVPCPKQVTVSLTPGPLERPADETSKKRVTHGVAGSIRGLKRPARLPSNLSWFLSWFPSLASSCRNIRAHVKLDSRWNDGGLLRFRFGFLYGQTPPTRHATRRSFPDAFNGSQAELRHSAYPLATDRGNGNAQVSGWAFFFFSLSFFSLMLTA